MLEQLKIHLNILKLQLIPDDPCSQDDSPHYHSRHSLIGIPHNEHRAAMSQAAVGPQVE